QRGNGLLVQINNGRLRGQESKTIGLNVTYIAYKGIPYAEPPTGNLRFEPPVPKRNWKFVLDAKKEGDICVQGLPLVHGSEDCLFINVYVPKMSQSNNQLLPTMVYIHGGGFTNGFSTYKKYGPDYLLEKDVVVVTFNYRLGIFGFLSTGDLVAPGNNGLKDQVLALKWVRDNIKSFGGDPNHVTIFGESAGAASVSYHVQSPQSQGDYCRKRLEKYNNSESFQDYFMQQ
ncbi:COesterase and/or Abhydrolase 3 domain containing protein, partial [Asbolus verrucosus]